MQCSAAVLWRVLTGAALCTCMFPLLCAVGLCRPMLDTERVPGVPALPRPANMSV
eukprot:NODE_25990_length_568_cov_6.285714.p3 GENE.NODE_25990_length_568_cov_6.285714~~NODE_25990_length_568_cov_6.285714.p3  ORF type:complete len:55 (+),score=2.27 NODE_25990_length_568_cov_6.285714:364-528(+)